MVKTKAKRLWVRKPLVQLDARGRVQTHGTHVPIRGIWHDTESHDLAGTRDLEGIVAFWRQQAAGYGAHLIIDKDGNTAQCADFDKVTWHTGGRNTGSIGIELVGFARFVPSVWWTRRKQLDKLAKWIAYLNLEYEIPIRFHVDKGWSGHRDQPAQSHTDPGPWFPKNYVIRRAKQFRANGWT